MEKMLTMIAAEEANQYEKAKAAMMTDATEAVTAEFASNKELKKAALTSAIFPVWPILTPLIAKSA